ncbi:MAG: PAS domain S-box protein, partial [Akkermansiaceae bacterium]|nr:PAS domain S-box protein [Akkermansiaceae bacterium]
MATAFAFLIAFFQRALDRSRSAEGSFRRERRFLERILDTSPSGITVINPEGTLVFTNPCAEKLLGMSLKEFSPGTYNDLQKRLTDIDGSPLPEEELPFNQVLTSGQTRTGM